MILPENKKILAGGLVCGAVILVEGFFLFAGRMELAEKKDNLSLLYGRLARLHNRMPFPSIENTKKLEGNFDTLAFDSGERLAELKGNPFPRNVVEPADFSARAQRVIERFQVRAAKVGVRHPESFEVGFSQYASGGAVPEIQFVPRLSRQLHSVEIVADVLIQSGVASVDGFSRDFFEAAHQSKPPAAEKRRSSRRGPVLPEAIQPNMLEASAVGRGGHYYIERVGVSFTAKESGVWEVLRGLSKASNVAVVSGFSHETKSEILQYKPEEIGQGRGSDDDTRHYLAEGILVGENALSRSERIISGDALVQVHLIVDVYNFDPEDNGQ